MSPRRLTYFSSALTVIALGLPFGAEADVTVQEHTTLSVATFNAQGSTTESLSGDKRRTDIEVHCDASASLLCSRGPRSEVVRLDRSLLWAMESKQRRYSEFPLSAGKTSSCPVARQLVQTPDISKCEFSEPQFTTDKAREVLSIAGHSARLTQLKLMQACKQGQGPCEMVYSLDVWLARDEIPGLSDRGAFQQRYLTRIGLPTMSMPVAADFQPYLTPYTGALKQLSERAADLRGYPLKTVFRASFSGTLCGGGSSRNAKSVPAPLASAGSAAANAAASSSEHAAGWGTADAVERATGGNSIGSYVAGSTAGALAGRLVGGLLASRHNDPVKPASDEAAVDKQPATILAEFTVETTSVTLDPIPADHFEVPSGWSKRAAKSDAGSQALMCKK